MRPQGLRLGARACPHLLHHCVQRDATKMGVKPRSHDRDYPPLATSLYPTRRNEDGS